MKQSQITIIGAGIIGVACAAQLQMRGYQVTLIDREDPGEGCSKGNAGAFAFGAILPLISPGLLPKLPAMLLNPLGSLAISPYHLPLMLPWLLRFLLNARPGKVVENTTHMAAMLSRAAASYRSLLQEYGNRELIRESGWITVYESDRGYRSAVGDRRTLREHGIRLEEFSGEGLRELLPDLSTAVIHGVYTPDSWFTTDPQRLVQQLAQQISARGGRFRKAEVKGISQKNGRPLLITDSGSEPCEQLLLATGAWSKQLARSAGDRIPLDTERGYHLMLNHSGINPAMPVMSGEHHFVTTPMAAGLRLAGTSELAGLKRPPNYTRAEVLLKHARRLWPELQGEATERWMGFRPTLPDSLPVLGPSTKIPGLYYAFGHQHLGLTLGAISGELMADMITGQPAKIDMKPYRADRF
ncbi:MAG: FAD-binding oxidoreductase [Sedimenticola sp.]